MNEIETLREDIKEAAGAIEEVIQTLRAAYPGVAFRFTLQEIEVGRIDEPRRTIPDVQITAEI